MGAATRFAGTIVATLAASGLLASPALGDQCSVEVRWGDVRYENWPVRFAELERGRLLGEAEIPRCGDGGRCAPPEETVRAYAVAGASPDVALLAPGYDDELFIAPGTFPQLSEHPLHDAVFGAPDEPDYQEARCGETFAFEAVVTIATGSLRVEASVPEVGGLEESGEVWVELDSRTRVEGFDRDGVPTLEPGDEVLVTARICDAELVGPLAEAIRPAPGS